MADKVIRIGAGGGGDTPLVMMLSDDEDIAVGSGYPLNMIFSFCNKESIHPSAATTVTPPGAKYSKWIQENVCAEDRGDRHGLSIPETIKYLRSSTRFSNTDNIANSDKVLDYLEKYLSGELKSAEAVNGMCYQILPETEGSSLNAKQKKLLAINSPSNGRKDKDKTEFASLYVERSFAKLHPTKKLFMCTSISALTPDRWFHDGNPFIPDISYMDHMDKKSYESISQFLVENVDVFTQRFENEFYFCLQALHNTIVASKLKTVILYDVGGDICKGFADFFQKPTDKVNLLNFGRDENMLLMLLLIKKIHIPDLNIDVQILGAATDLWEDPEEAEKLIESVFEGCTKKPDSTELKEAILTKLNQGKAALDQSSKDLCFAPKRATSMFRNAVKHSLTTDAASKAVIIDKMEEGAKARKSRKTEDYLGSLSKEAIRGVIERNIARMARIFTYELKETPFLTKCLDQICFSVKQDKSLSMFAARLATTQMRNTNLNAQIYEETENFSEGSEDSSPKSEGSSGGGKKKKKPSSAKKKPSSAKKKKPSSTKKKKPSSAKKKVIRKHQGIYQSGPKAGRLKPGYCYTGKKMASGLKAIAKKVSKK